MVLVTLRPTNVFDPENNDEVILRVVWFGLVERAANVVESVGRWPAVQSFG